MNFQRKRYIIWTVLVLLMINSLDSSITMDSQKEEPIIQVQSGDKRKLKNYQCDRNMLFALGFLGYQEPVRQKLDMCLDIDYTCCTEEDQLEIYNNWIMGNERDHLIKRMAATQNVYVDFLDALEKVYSHAKKTSDILIFKKTSNCRIMSERIIKFQIKYISAKLKEAIASMHDFFLDTYTGFYCSICDGKYINFISVANKKFTLQKKVCKNMAEHVLQPLLYLNVHMTNLLNLIAKFLVSCDYKGRFKNSIPEQQYKFKVSQNLKTKLLKCKTAIHGTTWFENCLDICKEFKVTEYSKFFEPNKKKFLRYTKFIYKRLDAIKKFSIYDVVEQDVNKLDLIIKKPRVLEEKKKPKKKRKKGKSDSDEYLFKEDPFFDRSVYKSARESGIPFNFFTIEYKAKGIDLTEVGKTSTINVINYDNLKRRTIQKTIKQEKKAERKLKSRAHILLLTSLTLFNLLV